MRLSNRQEAVLSFVRANPGVTAADVTRYEWGGRGHSATYDRVKRLVRRGLIRTGKPASGRGIGLYAS